MDRNKKSYKKIMYVFALLIMVISQLGIATVFAEEIASNKGNTLKLSLDKSEYTKNEEIQVNIEGKEEELDGVTLTKSDELLEQNIEKIDKNHMKIVLLAQKEGNYQVAAKSSISLSNEVTINVYEQTETSTASSNKHLPFESYASSDINTTTSILENQNIAPKMGNMNVVTTPKEVQAGSLENVTFNLNADAGDIVESNGNIQIKIPKSAVASASGADLVSNLAYDTPVNFETKTSDVDNWILNFSIDVNKVDQTTTFQTIIRLSFKTAVFYVNGQDEPVNPYTVSASYVGEEATDTFTIIPVNNGRPPFGKYYYGDKDVDSSGTQYGVLEMNNPGKNKFAVVVNYDHIERSNVVLTDTLPEGTTLAPYPGAFDWATGDKTPIAGGVRIAEVSWDSEDNQSANYVTEDFLDDVSFDQSTRKITVNFGDIPKGKAYFIEYALDVTDPNYIQSQEFVRNNANMTFERGSYKTSVPLQIKNVIISNVGLSKQVNKHIVNLNDNELTYNLRFNVFSGTIPEGAVIQDTLDSSKANFVSWLSTIDDDLFEVSADNNTVKIVTKKEIIGPYIMDFKFNVDTSKLNVGEILENAATITNSDVTLLSSKVETKRIDGRILIKKIDEAGNPLSGAKFSIKDNSGNLVDSGATNSDGEYLSKPLDVGNYRVTETKTPDGFILDRNPHPVSVTSDSISPITMTLENKKDLGGVILTKVDEKTAEVLQGAVFELQTANGDAVRKGLVTDTKGKILVDKLEPGDYQFVETQAPTGYELAAAPAKFTIEKAQTKAAQVQITNKLTPGSVVLTKVDEKTGDVLQGAVFELQDQSGKVLQSSLATDSNGKLAVANLEPGDYQFVETQAPTGYERTTTPVTFTIKKAQAEAVQVQMSNKLTPGSAVLTKVDEKTGDVLQGAVFELQDQTGKVLQSDLTTDSSGKLAVTDLKPGDYQFVETRAPTGYELVATPVRFTIEKGQTDVVQIRIMNKLTPNSVVLTKLDEKTAEVLQGAVFELQDQTGKVLQSGLTTDSGGKLAVDNLPPGVYRFVETQAPTGYERKKTPVTFTIEKNQTEAVQVSMTNKQINGSIILDKIDGKTGHRLSGAKFELRDIHNRLVLKDLITDDSGRLAITSLKAGNYRLIETQAPSGYVIDTTPVEFTIKDGSKETIKLDKKNKQKNRTIRLEKKDSQSENLLPNANFNLLDNNGTIIYKDLKTNAQGVLEISDLEVGNYQLVETEAPNGYILNAKPVTFEVQEYTKLITLTKYNQLQSGKKRISSNNHTYLPNTGESNSIILLTIGLAISIALLIFLFIKLKLGWLN